MTSRSFLYKLYAAITDLLLPLLLRIRRFLARRLQLGDPRDWQERLGRWDSLPRKSMSRILIHAVSAGEMKVCQALIQSLRQKSPATRVVITTGNHAGRKTAEALRAPFPNVEAVGYLPWDAPSLLRPWLAQVDPDLVAVIETEIWPSFFRICHQGGIPVCIVNGRLYPRDVQRYRLARPLFAHVLEAVSLTGLQSESEKERFVQIGADPSRVQVIGNAKYDATCHFQPPPAGWQAALAPPLKLLLAGSTHAPEEQLLIDAFARLRRHFSSLRLGVAPREVRRTASIVQDIRKQELRPRLWSQGPPADPSSWDVLVVNEMGRLTSLYSLAPIAVIGGTFTRVGGHNLLEAAASGCAVIVGPHDDHVEDIVSRFQVGGALFQASRPDQLVTILQGLLSDEDKRRRAGQAAASIAHSGRGAADRYVDRMLDLVNL